MRLLRLILSLCFFVCASRATLAQTTSKPWIVEVSLDREFLTSVMRSTVWNELLQPISTAYADEASALMEPEREGELGTAFSGLTSLNSQGLYIHEVLSHAEAIIEGKALPQALSDRAGGSEKLTALSDALKSLRDKVKWDAFWVSHTFQRDAIVGPFRDDVFHKAAADLLRSLGSVDLSVTVLVSMQSSLVMPAEWSMNRKSLILSLPSLFAGGEPLSAGRVMQEVAKAIISSTLERQAGRVDRHSGWFSLVKQRLASEGIADWKSAVASSLAAAFVQRSLSKTGSSSDAAAFVKATEARGYDWQKFLSLPSTESNIELDLTKLLDQMDRIEPIFTGGEAPDPGLRDVWLTDEGLPVKKLTSGSAAAKAGIKVGDIVSAIGGVRINGSESFLKAWKRWDTADHGSKVPFTIKRGKTVFTAHVILEKSGAYKGFKRKPQ